jgi:penicillin-binding protein 1A
MQESTAYLMNKLLKNAVAAGTGTQARISGMTVAGKTGTTSNNFDRYFVGYTPYYVAAVWTGYQYSAKINYSGGNPAITMWKLVMEQIHEGLENKDFHVPEAGLTRATICADSGLQATDACAADVRGSRVIAVEMAEGTEPTESCAMHVFRDYCTEGKCLATPYCLPECVTTVALLDCVRTDYSQYEEEGRTKDRFVTEDAPYVVSHLEKTMGLVPTIAEDGTEIYPEVIGCPVHNMGTLYPWLDPNDPNYFPIDPNDPNYIPTYPDPEDELEGLGGWPNWWGTETEKSPVTPEVPAEPELEDPAGGEEDAPIDWWSNFGF